MVLFPQSFVFIIIIGSLIGTAVGAACLIVMFINDYRKKQVW